MAKKRVRFNEVGKKSPQGRREQKPHPAAKIFGRIGIVLLLLLPTYLAIIGYIVVKNRPQETIDTYYVSMELNGPQGSSFTAKPGDELFESFRNMLSDAVYTTGIPDTHTEGRYGVKMNTNTGDENYAFYFSASDSAAYFVNAGGTIYRTVDDRTDTFLNSTYAYELYPQSTPPVLTTAVTDKVTPTQLNWFYQTQNGTFASLTQVGVTNDVLTYPIANDVSFAFSIPPSSCTLTIRYDNVEQTYSSVNNISLPTLTQGTVLDIEIRASFAEDSRNNYHGSAVYRFRMTVVEAASFSLDATAKKFGDYFLLTCLNVRNETELVISASPALQTKPLIFRRGDLVYAYIPADTVCADPAAPRHLTVTYGSVSDTFDLTIQSTHLANDTTHQLTLNSSQLRGNWQEALNTLLVDTVRDKGAQAEAQGSSVFLPNVNFISPAQDAVCHVAFGDQLTVSDTSIQGKTAIFEYYETSGLVRAMAGGLVAEVGYNDLLGNYVILDHGGGIYTWYCGLAEVDNDLKNSASLSTPCFVALGETVGAAGQTGLGLSDTDGVMILASCGGTIISPQYLREHMTK